MSQSLVQDYKHIIFSTKDHRPYLNDPVIRRELNLYIAGICQQMESPPLIVRGTEDHVHILCKFSKCITVSDFVREIKEESSEWLRKKDKRLKKFSWQSGYGVFSISPIHISALYRIIENQDEQHKNESYQEEFRRILNRYDLVWDEDSVWD
jgi:REP-associated tyrosine transposase